MIATMPTGRHLRILLIATAAVCVYLSVRPLLTLENISTDASSPSEMWLIGCGVTERDLQHAPRFIESLAASAHVINQRVVIDLLLVTRPEDGHVFDRYAGLVKGTVGIRRTLHLTVPYQTAGHGGGVDIQRAFVVLRDRMLDYAQEKRYTAFMSLDSDIILKPDTLELMLMSKQPVVTAMYIPRWVREDVGSIMMVPSTDASHTAMQHVLRQCTHEHCDQICTHMNATINLHLVDTPALSLPAATVGGGCTLVRGSAMSARFEFGRMYCEILVPGSPSPYPIVYHGDDLGWGFQLILAGFQPHVLTGHVVEHLAGADTPTGLVPDQTVWSVDLSGLTVSAQLYSRGHSQSHSPAS